MPSTQPEGGFGIYLHWPFCEAKCPYCDFNSHVVKSIDHTQWRKAYLSELDRYAAEFPDRIVSSIFFGGGTPSLMEPETVATIIEKISSFWRTTNTVEITLEANPSSVEAQRFRDYRTAGVNRVSLGVQALNDADLRSLGRLHSVDDAYRAMDLAQKTFTRASFDLIYARQNQSLSAWEAELRTALARGFTHLSLYQLTVEDGTAFGERFARGLLRGLPDENLSADMYDLTRDLCETVDLHRYEVSNFASPGEESIHNLIYWKCGDYLGIGPGAHGRLSDEAGSRLATETKLSPSEWLRKALNGNGESTRNALTKQEQGQEALVMGLRLADGFPMDRFEQLSGTPVDSDGLKDLCDLGAISVHDGRIIVEKQYVKVLNAIAAKLQPA